MSKSQSPWENWKSWITLMGLLYTRLSSCTSNRPGWPPARWRTGSCRDNSNWPHSRATRWWWTWPQPGRSIREHGFLKLRAFWRLFEPTTSFPGGCVKWPLKLKWLMQGQLSYWAGQENAKTWNKSYVCYKTAKLTMIRKNLTLQIKIRNKFWRKLIKFLPKWTFSSFFLS